MNKRIDPLRAHGAHDFLRDLHGCVAEQYHDTKRKPKQAAQAPKLPKGHIWETYASRTPFQSCQKRGQAWSRWRIVPSQYHRRLDWTKVVTGSTLHIESHREAQQSGNPKMLHPTLLSVSKQHAVLTPGSAAKITCLESCFLSTSLTSGGRSLHAPTKGCAPKDPPLNTKQAKIPKQSRATEKTFPELFQKTTSQIVPLKIRAQYRTSLSQCDKRFHFLVQTNRSMLLLPKAHTSLHNGATQ